MTENQVRQWAAEFPLGRMGTPEDVALATLFLASEGFIVADWRRAGCGRGQDHALSPSDFA